MYLFIFLQGPRLGWYVNTNLSCMDNGYVCMYVWFYSVLHWRCSRMWSQSQGATLSWIQLDSENIVYLSLYDAIQNTFYLYKGEKTMHLYFFYFFLSHWILSNLTKQYTVCTTCWKQSENISVYKIQAKLISTSVWVSVAEGRWMSTLRPHNSGLFPGWL